MTKHKFNRADILQERFQYLTRAPNAFSGNTQARADYLLYLEENHVSFTHYQFDLSVGLILSDASLAISNSKTTHRIKMQQSIAHLPWLEHIRECLREYSASDRVFSVNKRNMVEFQTLTCSQFNQFSPLFYNGTKKIVGDIIPYITPVSVAYWFCGDGNQRGNNQGKAVELNTQGFTKEECDFLVQSLCKNIGLIATVYDVSLPGKPAKYRLNISGKSFETFVEKVGPYIDPSMFYKVPGGRSDVSKFGYMNKALRDKYLGSKLVGNYVEAYEREDFK